MNEYVDNAHPLSPESLNSANMTPSTQQRRKRGFNRDPNDVFAKCGLTDIEAHELNAALKRSKADVLKASIVFLQQKKISIKKHNIIREATGLLKHQVFEELTVQSRWSSERARQLLSHPKVISNLHRRVTRAFGHKLRHSKISSDQATIDPAQLVGDIDVDSVKELLDTYGRSWSDPMEKSKQPSMTHIHLDDSHDDDIDAVEYQSSDSSEPKHTPRKSTRSIQKSAKPSFKRQRIESSEDEIEFERVDEKLQPQSNPSIVDDNPPHQNIIITRDEVAMKSFPKVTQQTVNRVVWHSYGTAISLINQYFNIRRRSCLERDQYLAASHEQRSALLQDELALFGIISTSSYIEERQLQLLTVLKDHAVGWFVCKDGEVTWDITKIESASRPRHVEALRDDIVDEDPIQTE